MTDTTCTWHRQANAVVYWTCDHSHTTVRLCEPCYTAWQANAAKAPTVLAPVIVGTPRRKEVR